MLEVLARIRHRRTRRQLSPYLDGVLSARESRRLEAHLAQCQACRDELAELRATIQTLAELPLADAPRSFALTAAPRQVEAPRPAAGRLEFGLRLATAAAAFVLAAIVVSDLLGVPAENEQEGRMAARVELQAAPTEPGVAEKSQQLPSAMAGDNAVTEAPTAPPAGAGAAGEATPVPSYSSDFGAYGEGEATAEPPAGFGEPPAANATETVPQMAVPGVEAGTPAATATPPPLGTVTIGPAGLVYVVQPGDTLTALSERFDLSPEAIAAANGMAESQPLLAEQELVIPGAVYHVQPGDTLADIAAAFGVPEAVIVTANSIAAPGAIGAGEPLAIPGGGALPATEAPSPTAEQPRPTPTAPPMGAQIAPSEPEQPPSGAENQALAEADRDSLAAEDGGPSRETVLRWLEIGLGAGLALLFVSWFLARRRGQA